MVVTGAKVRGLEEEGVVVGVVKATIGGVKTDLFTAKGGVEAAAGERDFSSLTLSRDGALVAAGA